MEKESIGSGLVVKGTFRSVGCGAIVVKLVLLILRKLQTHRLSLLYIAASPGE
jgi:hypothetical protein